MIQKLRRKFILINMALVTLVLVIVFSIFCITNYQKLERQSYDDMYHALGWKPGLDFPKFEIGEKQKRGRPPSMTPIFCVQVDKDGNVALVTAENVTVSQETLEEAVALALEKGIDVGILNSLDLRFVMEKNAEGIKIVFADRSNEKSTMSGILLTSILVGMGGLGAFFIISLFLSNWALKPVEKAWEQQRQFIADASHELKTPLTVILANTGILLSHKEDTIQKQSKWIENTQAEATRMKKMVEDLLFLAKSDSARLPMLSGECNLSETAWSCLLPFEPIAFEQEILLQSDVAENVNLIGNEGQLKQLILILLDNACKYSSKHGIISFKLEMIAEKEKIKMTVNNTGTPIPKEHLEHLFERFYRADKARSREQGGYGLGLAIARQIVENHHGKISVASNAEEGTTFTVLLPLKSGMEKHKNGTDKKGRI